MTETRPQSRRLAACAGAGLAGGLWAGLLAAAGEAIWLAAHGGRADWPLLPGGSGLVRGLLFALAGIPVGGVFRAFKRPADVRSVFAAALGVLVCAAILWIGPGLLQRGMLEGHPLGFPHYAMLTLFALTLGFILALDAAWVLRHFPPKALYVVFGLGVAAMVLFGFRPAQPEEPEERQPAMESPSSKSSP